MYLAGLPEGPRLTLTKMESSMTLHDNVNFLKFKTKIPRAIVTAGQ